MKGLVSKISTVIGTLLCIIFGFMLMCNLIIIGKGTLNPSEPPTVFGLTPMVVLSGSMSGTSEGHIEVGDLIFDVEPDIGSLKEGDVITYMVDSIAVTHRIVDIYKDDDGQTKYVTKGDANNVEDEPITAKDIIGIYKFRIPRLGDFAMFLQKPIGMLIFIGIPVCAFILYDLVQRRRADKKSDDENAELKAELEALKKELEQKEK